MSLGYGEVVLPAGLRCHTRSDGTTILTKPNGSETALGPHQRIRRSPSGNRLFAFYGPQLSGYQPSNRPPSEPFTLHPPTYPHPTDNGTLPYQGGISVRTTCCRPCTEVPVPQLSCEFPSDPYERVLIDQDSISRTVCVTCRRKVFAGVCRLPGYTYDKSFVAGDCQGQSPLTAKLGPGVLPPRPPGSPPQSALGQSWYNSGGNSYSQSDQ